MRLNTLIQNNDLIRRIDLLLLPEKGQQELSYERFCENYESLCDMRRRKLKLIK